MLRPQGPGGRGSRIVLEMADLCWGPLGPSVTKTDCQGRGRGIEDSVCPLLVHFVLCSREASFGFGFLIWRVGCGPSLVPRASVREEAKGTSEPG